MASTHRQLGDSHGSAPLRESLEGPALLSPRLQTSGPQRCGSTHFCCTKPPSLWPLVMAVLGNTPTVLTAHAQQMDYQEMVFQLLKRESLALQSCGHHVASSQMFVLVAVPTFRRLGGLNNRGLCSHSPGRLEVPDQGVLGVGFF